MEIGMMENKMELEYIIVEIKYINVIGEMENLLKFLLIKLKIILKKNFLQKI